MQLKVWGWYITSITANKCLSVCEQLEVVLKNKVGPSLSMQTYWSEQWAKTI